MFLSFFSAEKSSIVHRTSNNVSMDFTFNTVPEGGSVNMRGPEKFVP